MKALFLALLLSITATAQARDYNGFKVEILHPDSETKVYRFSTPPGKTDSIALKTTGSYNCFLSPAFDGLTLSGGEVSCFLIGGNKSLMTEMAFVCSDSGIIKLYESAKVRAPLKDMKRTAILAECE